MTRLIEVPTQFDDRSFDQFAAAYAQAADGERLLFDAHAAEWASPYGLVSLLAAGEAATRKGERPLLTVPANPDVVSYWARAGFFREAAELFEVHGKLARRVVVIAVADAGVGFRHSLEATQAKRFGERWGDAAALEAALVQGVSRFRDPGRGQGLAGIRRYVARWEGKVAIRSGTARIAIVPRWDDDVPLKEGLPAFPGSQVLLIIPEQVAEKSGGSSKR